MKKGVKIKPEEIIAILRQIEVMINGLKVNADIDKVHESFVTFLNQNSYLKCNHPISSENALKLYFSQNADWQENPSHKDRSILWSKILNIKNEFIGKEDMAVSKPISNAIDKDYSIRSSPPWRNKAKKVVISVNNYLKKKLEAYKTWFPAVQEYSFKQGNLGDCYFLAAIDSLIHKPNGFKKIKNMVKINDKGDFFITFPKNKATKFRKWVFRPVDWKELQKVGATGPFWIKAFEQAFAEIKNTKPDASKLEKLKNIGEGDSPSNVFEVLGLEPSREPIKFLSSDYIKKVIKEHVNNPNGFFCVGTYEKLRCSEEIAQKYDLHPQHAYSLNGYDDKKDAVIINNPHNNAIEIHVPLGVFLRNFDSLYRGELNSGKGGGNGYAGDILKCEAIQERTISLTTELTESAKNHEIIDALESPLDKDKMAKVIKTAELERIELARKAEIERKAEPEREVEPRRNIDNRLLGLNLY